MQENVRNFQYSRVGVTDEGMTNWIPQRTQICGYRDTIQMISNILSVRGRVVSSSNQYFSVALGLFYRRDNMVGNAMNTPTGVVVAYYLGDPCVSVGLGGQSSGVLDVPNVPVVDPERPVQEGRPV